MTAFFYVNSFSIFGKNELLKFFRNIFLLILFPFFSCTNRDGLNPADNSSEDSLSIYLTLANDFNLPKMERQKYNQKAFLIISDKPNDSINRANLFKIANRYYNMDNWEDYKKTVKVVLERSKTINDTVNILKSFIYLGDYYGAQGESDTAFMYYFKAEKIYLNRQDNYNLARTRLNKALLKYNESDFLGTEIEVFKALSAIKGEKANDLIYESYNLLGLIYNEQGDYDKAIGYQNKALASIDNKVIPLVFQSKATSLNNIGFVYQNLNKHKEAKAYFIQGLEQKDLITDKPSLYAILLDNLAYSKFKLKESEGLPELFYKSLKIRDSLQLTAGVILNKIHLSEYFASKKDTVQAIRYSDEALMLSRKTKNYRNVLGALKQLAAIEPKKASSYTKEYIHINDSLQKVERKIRDKFTRIEYETDEIKSENTSLTTQNRNLVFIFSGLAMLGLFTFVIKTQKAKNRELLFKQQQQKANEEIYNLMISQQNTIEGIRIKEKKRVARELHDGVLGRMFGVRINLDSLNKIDDGTAVEKRNNYLTELKSIEQDIREISHDLNREKSELINNFVAIVDNLFEDQKKTFKSKLVSIIDSGIKWELVSNSVKINLYRILQEVLQNVNKYAIADNIKIELKKEEDHLILMMSDDGVGFNVKTAKKGIGLQNILFRTNECDGVVDIKSKKGEGTIITITVPIE
ncbi:MULTISPECIES: tetratricopeptide repeat-containing sensor histidine kinase [unclassified Flavobacterium]|uniref:tetratricopeptide repeat-containing sensor histidine kinase n=1 Tax=unclassified Flavobacterium TaxID=196869 RepID=UPI000C18BBE3|nr:MULTISPECIES: tetratricopeptide repeat-containing sensor histidine kinase [unclassified Flavobacterium]PIF61516.1 histidine kinase/DNA gyrase B/HSP90-like ATPase [Flavobacterium sp. 11]WKL42624.1 tetratricopeptide repeat protein [Flavobacterium sp. ZE23DGlu08]